MEEIDVLKDDHNTNILEEEEFHESLPVIEQILETNGYSWKTWKNILLVSTLILTDGLIMMTFALMIIPFQQFYQLTSFELQIISSILFAGVAIGAITSGFILSRFFRPQIMNSSLFFIVILHLIVAFVSNKIIFTICRFLIGLTLGFYLPLLTNLLAESLPVRHRAMTLTVIWVGFGLGIIVLCLTALIIMPNLESNKIMLVFLIIAVVFALILLVNLIFLNDSARNYLVKTEFHKGFELLEELYGKKLKTEYRERIIKEIQSNNKNKTNANFSTIFNDKICSTTIMLVLIWFIDSFVSYGPNLVSTLTMKKLGSNMENSNHQIIINMIIVNIPIPISLVFGGFLTEVSIIGRKRTLAICFLMGGFFITLCTIFTSQFSLLLGCALSFLIIAFSVTGAYSSEVYPTSYRDFALGLFFTSTRLGGFFSQIIYLNLFEINMFLPYYTTCAIAILGAVLSICLPFETYGIPLDFDHSQETKVILSEDIIKKKKNLFKT